MTIWVKLNKSEILNPLKTRLKKLAMASALVALGQNVFGLGLGELNHSSSLGQPLDARIQIINPEKNYTVDELKVRHLDAEQAATMGVELLSFYQRFDIKPVMKNGQLYIDLTSEDPVTEPFINLFIELKWPTGQIYREYTLLLDPPNIQLSQSAPQQASSTARVNLKPSAQSSQNALPSKRAAQRSTAMANVSQDDYRVRSGDSLSKIAQRVSRNTAYDYRDVMNWLFVNNPHAFIKADPNRLKAAVVLSLPNQKTWSRVERPQQQIEQPIPRPQQSAVAKTITPSMSKQVAAPVALEQAPRFAGPVLTDDRLSLKTGSLKGDEPKDLNKLNKEQLKQRIRGTKEQNDRLLRENTAIEARLKRLGGSDYIRSLERLVQLRDQEIAELKALANQQSPGEAEGGIATQSSGEQALLMVDSQLGAAAKSPSPEEPSKLNNSGDTAGQGTVDNRLLLWVLLIITAIGSAYFYLNSRRPDKEIDYETADYDENAELARLDEALADQDDAIGFDSNEEGDLSFTSLFDESGQPTGADHVGKWRPDEELAKKIQAKTQEYVPGAPKGFSVVHHQEHDNLDDLISDALAYCAQGYYDRAESMLMGEEATRGSESRINTALDYVRNLRDQA